MNLLHLASVDNLGSIPVLINTTKMKLCKVDFKVEVFGLLGILLTLIPTTMSVTSDRFSAQFFENVLQTPGNLFFSPVSVKMLLALTAPGAGGLTAAQLKEIAGVANDKKSIQLANFLATPLENIILNAANGVFIDAKCEIKPYYEKFLKTEFKTELMQLDFTKGNDATQNVNAWVSAKTNHKIPQLFEQGSLNSDTKLVLANAIYFKANWQEAFPIENTKKRIFHVSGNEKKEVDFMTASPELRAIEGPDAQIVELPYKGANASLILVIPTKIGGLSTIERQFMDTDLAYQIVKDVEQREVVLTVPKFKLEQTLQLKPILMKMGITDLFNPEQADLSGISDQPLYVSGAVHKAFIEFNEEGAEAAAASGLSVSFRMMEEPLRVVADSPFLFFIQAQGVVLFAGRVTDPSG